MTDHLARLGARSVGKAASLPRPARPPVPASSAVRPPKIDDPEAVGSPGPPPTARPPVPRPHELRLAPEPASIPGPTPTPTDDRLPEGLEGDPRRVSPHPVDVPDHAPTPRPAPDRATGVGAGHALTGSTGRLVAADDRDPAGDDRRPAAVRSEAVGPARTPAPIVPRQEASPSFVDRAPDGGAPTPTATPTPIVVRTSPNLVVPVGDVRPEVRSRDERAPAGFSSALVSDGEPSVIRVSIGRIEVRAPQAPPPAPARECHGPSTLSLDDYLRSRQGRVAGR